MRWFLTGLVRAAALVALTGPGFARAQDQSQDQAGDVTARMVGLWRVDIAAEPSRAHLLSVIRLKAAGPETYQVTATYGYVDTRRLSAETTLARVEGRWVLSILTRRDARLELESPDLEAFTGTIRYKQGPSSTVRMTREPRP